MALCAIGVKAVKAGFQSIAQSRALCAVGLNTQCRLSCALCFSGQAPNVGHTGTHRESQGARKDTIVQRWVT